MRSRRDKIVIGVLVGLLVVGLFFKYSANLWGDRDASSKSNTKEIIINADNKNNSAAGEIIIHIVGAVVTPGIYILQEGARVNDAITLAGGPATDADTENLNIARPLIDGEQIRVPRIGEVAEMPTGSYGEAGSAAGNKININRANVSELNSLSGIGEKRAQSIVSYREEHGPFKQIEDIMNVSGIGQGIFNNIKDQITVY